MVLIFLMVTVVFLISIDGILKISKNRSTK